MFDRRRHFVSLLRLLILAVWCAAACMAQAPVGSLMGTAHDSTGAIMPGVTVTVTNKDTGLTRPMTTSAEGIFSAASLPAGNYSVKATATGFRSLEVSATVQTGQVTNVDLELQVGAEAEVINVQGETAQITYDSHEISGVITHQNIEQLPVNGRSFLQLSMLEPGVNVTANNVGQYNKQFDVSILGASSANNSVRITVDGATVQDSITGGTQQNFSQEVVQEFQLSSTNFDLSTGIGAGGAINVVTRSGGNDFHGSAFLFYRDHNLSAFPFLAHEPGEPDSPYFARKQEGFWFGGPVKKDKLFFFTSLEHIDQTSLFSAFPSDPALQAFGTNAASPYHANELTERIDWRINAKHNAFLRYSHDGNNSFAPPGIGDLPSDWADNTNWADSGVFSLISVITPATANEFRYSYTFWSNVNAPPPLSQCPAPCNGWGYTPLQTGYVNADGPMITVLGVNNFALGESATSPQSRLLRRHIFADNVSSQKGTHSIKFGGYWEYQKGTGSYAYAQPAAMELWSPELVQQFNQKLVSEGYASNQIQIPSSFNTMSDLLQLPVAAFTIGVGNPTQPPLYQRGNADHDNLFHFYGEDTWKIHPRFSLNYGLAWSYESNALNFDLNKPGYLAPIFGANNLGQEQHSPRDFSPMLGFAWTVTKDNKTVVRGGSAIYYDTWDIFNRLIERVILSPVGVGRIPLPDSAFFPAISQLEGFGSLPAAIQPTSLSSQPTIFTGGSLERLYSIFVSQAEIELNSGAAVPNVDLFKTGQGLIPRNFRLPYSEHASIGIQRELRSDLVLSADFVFRQYMHQLINDADLNHYNSATGPIIPKCLPGQALQLSVECSAGPIEAEISGARGHYKGLLMKLDKRFSHRTTATLAYAYADVVGYNGLIDNSNYFASWGPQAGHQTITGSLVAFLPGGIQLSGISTYQSAAPFQPFVTGVDFNGNGVFSTAGESLYPGAPLPGGGFNQFDMGKGKNDLIQLVNQYNQTYAGRTDPLGHPYPNITLPSSFNFPRPFTSQDIRVTKAFRLHGERVRLAVFGECFNIFNIANLTFYNEVLNAPGFGEASQRTSNIFGTGGPRAFQLGSRLTF